MATGKPSQKSSSRISTLHSQRLLCIVLLFFGCPVPLPALALALAYARPDIQSQWGLYRSTEEALPDGAVQRITSLQSDDVGEFGVEFFKLVLEKDPSLKVRIKIDASTGQLLSHGYLSVLAQGGMKVTWWLLKNGVKNPKAAIDRLRGR